jgi:hypothetical protein
MAALDSEETRRELTRKLGCQEVREGRHIRFILYDDDGTILTRTHISHRPRHTLPDNLVSRMARQIGLGKASNLVGLVDCSKSGEECLRLVREAARS